MVLAWQEPVQWQGIPSKGSKAEGILGSGTNGKLWGAARIEAGSTTQIDPWPANIFLHRLMVTIALAR
ncbi:hypothetical protein L1047_14660 [Synechococcus sp. Nb3U1]|uniref:hypothetical protein n=1 Tax=Synechococcus sp. Nb3U1 TaxID=1914529 RepID=UPI001F375CB1|nr:hypothetical protein [Synechococcus sp. Nb3U1]MCF2972434.1 hypothetical protein [Synechococcus sp. Nb3U1]